MAGLLQALHVTGGGAHHQARQPGETERKHQGFIGKINLQIPGILLQVVQMVTIYLSI